MQAFDDAHAANDVIRDKLVEELVVKDRQIRILAMELAHRRRVPDEDTCLEGCKKTHAGCTLCWIRWSRQQAEEEAMEEDDE